MQAPQEAGQGKIVIDPSIDSIVKQVYTNVDQELLVTTVDKVQICLMQVFQGMQLGSAWKTPLGILATLLIVFPTTAFKDWGLSKSTWEAFFLWAALLSIIWFLVSIWKAWRSPSPSVEQIIDRLKKKSLGVTEANDLYIIAAGYGAGNSRREVAKQLNDVIVDNKLHILVGNQIAGDPCPKVYKNLVVKYRYKGREHTKTFNESDDLDLP
ncbi:MAG: hypothetical protein JJE04_21220 [Acidobacteriia bacterium]|nr:hypothetical protein [Terriglobia bacterium]